jgi:uncharacterized integral membrane protein (TIGR00697 family)
MSHPASHSAPVIVAGKLSRREMLLFILGGFFITNAVVAEIIGGKLFTAQISLGPLWLPPAVLSIGLLPWPLVFLTTDLINEYFGKPAVRRLTFLTVAMISYVFLALYLAKSVPGHPEIGVPHEAFAAVAGQSMWIIAGSLVAFLVSQFVDVMVFWFFRRRTQGRQLWLRATGSTIVSQLIDTFVVTFIGLYLPGVMSLEVAIRSASTAYLYKVLIAVALTPLIYIFHGVIDAYLAKGDPSTSTPNR